MRSRRPLIRSLLAAFVIATTLVAGSATDAAQPDAASDLGDYYGGVLGPEVGGYSTTNIDGQFYDNFTGGQAQLDGFAIQAYGGVRFNTETLNADPYLALEGFGIEPGEVSFVEPDSAFPSGTVTALLQGDLADADAAVLAAAAEYAYDPGAPPLDRTMLFDGSFLGDPRIPDGLDIAYDEAVDALTLRDPGFAQRDWFGPNGALGCGAQTSASGNNYQVHCHPSDPGGTQFGTQWDLFSMKLDSPLTSMGTEAEAVWGFVLGSVPIWMGSFGGDFFNYTNLNYSLSVANGATTVTRFVLANNAWTPMDTGARIIEGDTSVYTLILPAGEAVPPIDGVRFSTFKAEGPRQSGNVSSFTHPPVSELFVPPEEFGDYTFTCPFDLSVILDDTVTGFQSQIEPPTPALTAAPEPTATTEPEPTPTTEVAASDSSATTTDSDDDGLNLGWVALGLGLLLLLGGAYLVFFDKRGDCEPLRKAWLAAKAKADAAEATAVGLEADCDQLNTDGGDLEDELDVQCEDWPPACRNDSAEESGDESTRVTTLDVTIRREWARHQWGEYRNGDISAEEAGSAREQRPPGEFEREMHARDVREKAERAQKQLDLAAKQVAARDKCAQAATARAQADAAGAAAARAEAKYLECIGKLIEAQAKTAEAAQLAEEQRQRQLQSGGGPSVAAQPPPEIGSSCDGQPDIRILRSKLRKMVLLQVEFGIVKQEHRLLGDDERTAVVNELHDLESGLGDLGRVLSGGSAGRNLYKGNRGAAVGDAASGVAGIPTNLPQAVVTLLQTIAGVITKAAEFANAVDAANSLYDVVFKTKGKFVSAKVWEVRYCEGGVWKCRTELEVEWGELISQDRSKRDLMRSDAQRASRRAAWTLRRLRRDSDEILGFISNNRPGPC